MSTMMTAAAAVALVLGVVLFAMSSKKPDEHGAWSNGLEWGYLLILAGVFGLLASWLSFNAVFLIFVVVCGIAWFWQRSLNKKNVKNHCTDTIGGFFPILLVIFLLRSFVVEPFQIPSSSMRPGLIVGDFILVDKFSYGIRLPIANNVLIPTGKVQRGDVVVFNYPVNPNENFIKRVVGLPGDTVVYKDKRLTINGRPVADADEHQTYSYTENMPEGQVPLEAQQWRETLEGKNFTVLKMPQIPPVVLSQLNSTEYAGVRAVRDQNCRYESDGSGFTCKVPAGHYFMMGDNRDNSADSRYWGFVDDRMIVGKAFLVWMNFHEMGRVGTVIR